MKLIVGLGNIGKEYEATVIILALWCWMNWPAAGV